VNWYWCWVLIAFLFGGILGAHYARVDCIKERCRVPCGEKYVEVHKEAADWTRWYCTCSEVP